MTISCVIAYNLLIHLWFVERCY